MKGTLKLLNHSVKIKCDEVNIKYPALETYFNFDLRKKSATYTGFDDCKGIQICCSAIIKIDDCKNQPFSYLEGYCERFPVKLLYGKKEGDVVFVRFNGINYELICKSIALKFKPIEKDPEEYVNPSFMYLFPYEYVGDDENGNSTYVKFEDQLHKSTASFGGMHSVIGDDEPDKNEQQDIIYKVHVEYSESVGKQPIPKEQIRVY